MVAPKLKMCLQKLGDLCLGLGDRDWPTASDHELGISLSVRATFHFHIYRREVIKEVEMPFKYSRNRI